MSFAQTEEMIQAQTLPSFDDEKTDASPSSLSEQVGATDETVADMLVVSGTLMDAHFYTQLETLYRTAEKSKHQVRWVIQQGEMLSLLSTETPLKEGYQEAPRPWLTLFFRLLSHPTLAKMLQIKCSDSTLEFFNGKICPLEPTTWQDASGKNIQLYQVVGLPDGTWLKITRIHHQKDLSMTEPTLFLSQVEDTLQALEKNTYHVRQDPPAYFEGLLSSPTSNTLL